MEKLTLEHISPYFDNYLKFINQKTGAVNALTGLKIEFLGKTKQLIMLLDTEDYYYLHCWGQYLKPILRPVSDFKKDEYFDLYLELCEELEMVNCENLINSLSSNEYYAMDLKKLWIVEEFMVKNHFDYRFNLIEKGLAIDVNTLETDPYANR